MIVGPLVGVWGALLGVPLARAGSVQVEQARIDLRAHYYAEALAEVQAGLLDPSGDAFELYTIGADAAWELGDIDHVLLFSDQAAGLALNPDAHDAWQARHDTVAATWGWLVIETEEVGMRAALELRAGSPVIDPEQKRIAEVILKRVVRPTALPARIPLPAGGWAVNGAGIDVVAGQTATLRLSGDQVGRIGVRALRLELALGAELPGGAQFTRFGPGAAAELAASAPLSAGRLRAGAAVSWTPLSFVTDNGQTIASPWAGAFGLTLGVDAPMAGGLAARMRAGPEVVLSEGVSVLCPAESCVAPTLYVPAWSVGPAARLGVDIREGPAIVGVSLGGSLTFGATLRGGVAEVEDQRVRWTMDPQPLTRGSLRISAYLGI